MLQPTDSDMAVRVLTEERINEHTQLRKKLLRTMQGGRVQCIFLTIKTSQLKTVW